MGLVINTNIASLVAQQNLNISNKQLKLNVQRMSSGYRVNSAADDAAGMARASLLRSNARGIQAALRNSNDGISALEIADQSAAKIGDILSRMNELAVSASQGTLDAETRGYYHLEWAELVKEIDRIANVTEFDGKKLLASGITVDIQIGFRSSADDRLRMTMGKMIASALGLNATAAGLSALTRAQSAMDIIKSAIKSINGTRARFGAFTNRLDATISNLQVTFTNIQAAESRIRDADFAHETALFTKNQILVQSGVSVLAQANTLPQSALTLLQ